VSLGWLVTERYGQKVQSAGSIVTAALKLEVARRHAASQSGNPITYEAIHNFTVNDLLRYLPKTIVQNFEKKDGGITPNLHRALKDLCLFRSPVVAEEVEVAPEQPEKTKFQIQTRRLISYLQDRIVHQVSTEQCRVTVP
jgi:hypothetical protein